MKRKAFHMSGGKDRKAKKDKFVFTASEEEAALPETEADTPKSEHSGSVSDAPPDAEPVTDVLHEIEAEKPYPAEIHESIVIAPKELPVPAENDEGLSEEHFSQTTPEADPTQAELPAQVTEPAEQLPTETPKLPEAEVEQVEAECDPNAPLPTFYNGPNLAEIRKRCGVKLRAIWEETKIPIITLENIEAENYEALPPEVYVRSFIGTYAKFLSLDPQKATKDYMERYRIWRAEYEKQQKRRSSLFSFGGKTGSFFGIKIKKS